MTSDSDKSVTHWINDLKTDDRDEAAPLLWNRYFERLARLAEARLRGARLGPADGEDVALSVLVSVFQGVAGERFPDLQEIAARLDCGLRTVERKLGVIRKRWLAEELK